MKTFSKIISAVLLVSMMLSTSLPAYASENDSNGEEIGAAILTIEADNMAFPAAETASLQPIPQNCYNSDEVVEYILNSPKSFTHVSSTLDISDLLAEAQILAANASGEVSDSFTSERFDTGTPGVTWDYSVDYTIAPHPNGNGWYFKDVSCTVYAYKGWLFYTWATVGLLDFTKAEHSLTPKPYPTSLTISMTLEFEIWTEATGANSITYSEDHTHTTSINNIATD